MKISYFALIAQILIIIFIWLQWITIGSVEGNFAYPYIGNPNYKNFFIALAILFLCFYYRQRLFEFINKSLKNKETFTICITFIVGTLLELWIRGASNNSLSSIIENVVANGYYTVAISDLSILDYLRNFSEVASLLPSHAKTNMPGKVIFFSALSAITNNVTLMGVIIVAISNITSIVIYLLCRTWFEKKYIAWLAMAIYILTPGKIEFQPILNTVNPVLIYVSLYLLTLSFVRLKLSLAFYSGCILFFQFIFDPLPFALGPFYLAVVLWYGWKMRSVFHPVLMCCSVLVGIIFMGLLFKWVFGFDVVKAFLYCLKEAMDFNAIYQRTYNVWVIQNLKEYFLGAGVASSIFVMSGLFHLIKEIKPLIKFDFQKYLLISFFITVLILDLLNFNRGEITRLWIFMYAIQSIAVASYACIIDPKNSFLVILGGATLQAIISIGLIGFC
jgi:hypothetical protein